MLLVPAVRPARAADAGNADKDKDYVIRFDRPAKAGDSYRLDALSATRLKRVVKAADDEPKTVEESVGVRLEGKVEVLAVTDKGKETKVACTVDNCTVTEGKASRQIINKGSVLVAEWKAGKGGDKGKCRYSLDGRELPDEAGQLLDRVLEVGDPEGAGDDEVFGTTDRQKVGAAWPMDAAAAAKDFGRMGMVVKKEDTSGSSRLADVADVDGVPCLKVECAFRARNIRGKDKGKEAGEDKDNLTTLDGGEMKATVVTLLPTDNKTGTLKEATDLKMNTSMAGKNEDGKSVKVEVTMEQLSEKTYGRK